MNPIPPEQSHSARLEAMARAIMDFARGRNWHVSAWDVLDILWLQAMFPPEARLQETERSLAPGNPVGKSAATAVGESGVPNIPKRKLDHARSREKDVAIYPYDHSVEPAAGSATSFYLPSPLAYQVMRTTLQSLRPLGLFRAGPSRVRKVLTSKPHLVAASLKSESTRSSNARKWTGN